MQERTPDVYFVETMLFMGVIALITGIISMQSRTIVSVVLLLYRITMFDINDSTIAATYLLGALA